MEVVFLFFLLMFSKLVCGSMVLYLLWFWKILDFYFFKYLSFVLSFLYSTPITHILYFLKISHITPMLYSGVFFFSYFFLLAFQFGTFLLIFLYVHWIQLCHIYWWAHQRHSSFMLLYFFTSRSSFWFFPSFCLHYPYVLSLYLFIPLEFIML